MHPNYWKDTADDLRKQAQMVTLDVQLPGYTVSARQAAAVLTGICSLIARRFTTNEMQRACADLARMEDLDFGRLPTGVNGIVSEPVALIASVARPLRNLCGENNLRAALSFWATEDDPGVWNQIAA